MYYAFSIVTMIISHAYTVILDRLNMDFGYY